MSTALRPGGLLAARPHCTCVEVRNYDYDEAADKLKCHKRHLEDRIGQIPHQKLGMSVAFCDCDLRVIQAMGAVIPDDLRRDLFPEEPDSPAPAEQPRSLHGIRPAGARRRTTDTRT